MPVVEFEQRLRARARIEEMQKGRQFYPLTHPQRRPLFDVGFIDYTISSTGDFEQQNLNFNFDGGAAFLGGAIRGGLNGFSSDGQINTGFSNIRWEYARPESSLLSRIDAGEVRSGGLRARNIRGAAITNEPIEARYFFGTIRQDGTTEADATVELYMNNQLVQFTTADATGYYKFDIPLNYGQTRLEKVFYFTDGRIERRSLRIQTPFSFQPQGVLTYHVDGGYQIQGAELLGRDRLFVGSGRLSYGVTKWLTTRIGTDYVEDADPFVYGGFSARVLSQYLLNADFAPDAYYEGSVAVVYPNNVSLNARHRYYDGASVFNTRDLSSESSLSLGLPVRPLPLRLQIRSLTYNDGLSEYDFGADTNYRLFASNFQLQYRTRIFDRGDEGVEFTNQTLRTSLSYGVRRGLGLPEFMDILTGTTARISSTYDIDLGEFRDMDVQISRRIFGEGNLQLSMGHAFASSRTVFRFSLNFRLDNKVAVTTSHSYQRERYSMRNSVRGSLGLDSRSGVIQPTFRNQVGRAAASVILFIDKNNSGTFDEGDEILPYNAIRLSGSGRGDVGRDGIVRLTQLQSYARYNLEIIERMIPNATLVPAQDKFSFIADPNQYKRIEIPFYQSGTIEGMVSLVRPEGSRGVGGVRLEVIGQDNSFRETIRTFNSGDFFLMNIPPGRYLLEVSSAQLDLLGLAPGDVYSFEIKPTTFGDYVDGLNIELFPVETEEVIPSLLAEEVVVNARTRIEAVRTLLGEQPRLERQLRSDAREALRLFTFAQQHFTSGDFDQALRVVTESLERSETGDQEQAMQYWQRARRLNPNIEIPDVEAILEELNR
ncbi:hypothetical protein CYPRO_2784 [Cyclonatronum proteinivorum]|uniref:Carboxypeptidase regulatory-like domain-containing protein n=1 Tax=Cyclonatronum proteinivorum TaxID=1457365 RepID=A0A345UNH1_9BACT|nr:hypothetical protein [Cyclonatronum proteinivorum]AXJ02023.1 hypothetical protein CYPRO_2784 [Cyclonatronum proteinivorum]